MNPDETPVAETDTEETPVVDGAETPEVKEDGDDEETDAPEAGAMPAEDGDHSDAI